MDQKNLIKFPDQVPPTLESLPTEVQLQICREMLRSEKPITLSPCKPYVSRFGFGSLGILRVSKYFSTLALSVMYGENCFRLRSANWIIKDDDLEDEDLEDEDLEDEDLEDENLESDDLEDDDLEDDENTVHINTLRHSPWANLRNIHHTLFGNLVSSVDCLDMISQTSPGQTFLKHLRIDFGAVASVRVMDGVLLRILKRMRGLQTVELHLLSDWGGIILYYPLINKEKWQERNARDFLLLIREELSHIKKITMDWSIFWANDLAIIKWMADELDKRNEAWTPPLPSYKKFRRTFSPMSIMDAEVAKSVVDIDDKYRSKDHEENLAHLERLRGVF